MTTTEDVIRAAASVGRDVAEGKLASAALSAAVADECRALFGTVIGPADPLWAVHLDIARQVLALDGLSVDELSQWMAVARSRTGGQSPPAVQPAERAGEPRGHIDTAGHVSPASGAHSSEIDGMATESDT